VEAAARLCRGRMEDTPKRGLEPALETGDAELLLPTLPVFWRSSEARVIRGSLGDTALG